MKFDSFLEIDVGHIALQSWLYMIEEDVYLLIFVVVIAIYADFGWFSAIYNFKWLIKPQNPLGKSERWIPTI